jgi:hypothetical protein
VESEDGLPEVMPQPTSKKRAMSRGPALMQRAEMMVRMRAWRRGALVDIGMIRFPRLG